MAQVASRSAEIAHLNTRIVAISFGTPAWVQAWRDTTTALFPVWLDAERVAYAAYGLRRSVRASWGVRNLWYYAKAIARGTKLQPFRGDTAQLGGNFIIDRQGVVRFAYPSRDPTDRPHVEQLLNVLRGLA